jgi:tRNA(His) 5'-end guanylyltransferase
MSSDSLGDRMKSFYEDAFRAKLPGRMPVILRVDGKAFHSYTRGCERPFDDKLIAAMNTVALTLCQEIQGAKIAYVQSDEISILIHNYTKLDTSAWFNNNIQKMVSVAAGIASGVMTEESQSIFPEMKRAVFDARVFVLPEAEVCNYFLWRQQDCSRNSVQMVARSLYSHKDCENKNNSELQEMILQKGQNWDKIATHYKRGRCWVKTHARWPEEPGLGHLNWNLDQEIPIFSQDRTYIEQHLAREQE